MVEAPIVQEWSSLEMPTRVVKSQAQRAQGKDTYERGVMALTTHHRKLARETGGCKLQILTDYFHPKLVTQNHPARLSHPWTPETTPAWEQHGNHRQHKPQFTSPHSWFRNRFSSANSGKANLPHKESLKQNKEAQRSPGENCRIWQSLLTGASQDFSSVTGCQKKMPI